MNAWLTTRDGETIDDVSPGAVTQLVGSVFGINDPEHGSVSVTTEDGWNLEFYADSVPFENVETDTGEIGWLRGLTFEQRVELALQLVRGELGLVRARPWSAGS
jgi:hypothetical protein